jgi:hypothetical protein
LDFQGNLCVAFTLFALGYIAAHYALQLYFPVIYIWVSTEDSWVEYGTFAAFALTAFLVGRLALQPGARLRRAIWAIIAVVAALVALDEISWGQRIIGLRTPEPLLEINRQGEITFHNLEGVSGKMMRLSLSYGLVAWIVISVVALWARRRFNVDPMASGLPFFPMRLVPFGLVVVWLNIAAPVVKTGEFSEFVISLFALTWATDLYAHFSTRPPRYWEGLLRRRVTAFVAVALMTGALTLTFPGYYRWHLNEAAAEYYPKMGYMKQSREIFEFILANPKYINDETVENYRRLFPNQGVQ